MFFFKKHSAECIRLVHLHRKTMEKHISTSKKTRNTVLRNGFKNIYIFALRNVSSAMLPSNKTVAMPTCYCKQKRTTLAPPPGSSDWSTVLELTSMRGAVCKSWNSFNLTQHLKNTTVMCEKLRKMWDANATLIHVHLACLHRKTMEK